MGLGVGTYAVANSASGLLASALIWLAWLLLIICPVLSGTLYVFLALHRDARVKDAQTGLGRATLFAFGVAAAAALMLM